jgi:dTMP kinase
MKKIFVLEGGEFTGKSTCISLLKPMFEEYNIKPYYTREPGGCVISEEIRSVLLNHRTEEMDTLTELLLFSAARRAHLINKIIPIMNDDIHDLIIMDRYFYSSLVYQGYLREDTNRMDGITNAWEITKQALSFRDIAYNFYPTGVFIFEMDVEKALSRKRDINEVNRIDAKSLEFHKALKNGYHTVAGTSHIYQPNIKNYFIDADRFPSVIAEEVFTKILNMYVER